MREEGERREGGRRERKGGGEGVLTPVTLTPQ